LHSSDAFVSIPLCKKRACQHICNAPPAGEFKTKHQSRTFLLIKFNEKTDGSFHLQILLTAAKTHPSQK